MVLDMIYDRQYRHELALTIMFMENRHYREARSIADASIDRIQEMERIEQ